MTQSDLIEQVWPETSLLIVAAEQDKISDRFASVLSFVAKHSSGLVEYIDEFDALASEIEPEVLHRRVGIDVKPGERAAAKAMDKGRIRCSDVIACSTMSPDTFEAALTACESGHKVILASPAEGLWEAMGATVMCGASEPERTLRCRIAVLSLSETGRQVLRLDADSWKAVASDDRKSLLERVVYDSEQPLLPMISADLLASLPARFIDAVHAVYP